MTNLELFATKLNTAIIYIDSCFITLVNIKDELDTLKLEQKQLIKENEMLKRNTAVRAISASSGNTGPAISASGGNTGPANTNSNKRSATSAFGKLPVDSDSILPLTGSNLLAQRLLPKNTPILSAPNLNKRSAVSAFGELETVSDSDSIQPRTRPFSFGVSPFKLNESDESTPFLFESNESPPFIFGGFSSANIPTNNFN